MQTEHRRAPRHLLGGAVEVIDLETGKQIVTVARNFIMSAQQAKEYGLIDEIIQKHR
jgi:ATP-dependent protease ClpP protease subunit